MQYKCSLNNNYEIIGLCDIEKFNEKIIKFIDKSWTQITISEKVVLPSEKPNIKTLMKIYLSIKINSAKIINTPSSDVANIEGLKITEKILLVLGEIYQNVVYLSEELNNPMGTVKFKKSFTSYIVIDKDSDLEDDKYYVYPYVEDVFIIPLDKRNLSENINLFLFARRIKGDYIKKLPNVIIVNNEHNDKVINIEFDSTNKKFLVNSTGENSTNNFTMTLYKSDATTEKKKSKVNPNETGDKFKNDFNDIGFEFGDLIKLEYDDRTKIVITNFPNVDDLNYYNPNTDYEWFRITRNGLQNPNAFLLTKFIFKNSSDEEVGTVEFNKITKKLLVISTGEIFDANSPLSFSLQKLDGTLAITGFISRGDAYEFKRILDGAKFEYNDIVFLNFKNNKSKVTLINYPNNGDIYSMIADDEQVFKITENGIVENISPNIITLNNTNNQSVVIIKIQENKQKLLVKSTGNLANPGGTDYFKMTVNDVIISQVTGNSNAVTFEDDFNSKNIEENSIIKLECIEPNQVTITNFPNVSMPIYKLTNTVENFKVTPNGLEAIIPQAEILPNNIIIRNVGRNNEEIAKIRFDKTNQKLIVTSTGKKLNRQNIVTFKLSPASGLNVIFEKIDGDSDATSFVRALNEKKFKYTDIVYTASRQFDSILVSNFPQKEQDYIQPSMIQSYEITNKGLVENILPNIITVSSINNNPVVVIKFDANTPRLVIDSLMLEKPDPTLGIQNYFEFKLDNFTQGIKGNQNAEDFKRLFYMISFSVGQIITIKCVRPEKVTITNFPDSNTPIYILKNNEERFKIGTERLEKI